MNMNWESAGKYDLNFTIPKTTSSGRYLVRAEQFFIWTSYAFNSTQFYLNCGQIEVVGEGGGTLELLVKFPGAYDYFDPSLWIASLFTKTSPLDLATYVPPGPPVWSG